jgi:UDP-N-acetylmuramate dehydrogenase
VRPTPRDIEEIRGILILSGRVHTDVPLSRYTSFRIGGPADVLAEPGDLKELTELLRYLDGRGMTRLLLGAGTNVLFRDDGFRGVVIRTGLIRGCRIDADESDTARVCVAAGEPLAALIKKTCNDGWGGMEPMWGIPGTFGGAVVTNAGAGGVSLGDLLEEIRLLTLEGEEILLTKDDVRCGYRFMDLPGAGIVMEGTLRLERRDKALIDENLNAARGRRKETQPWNELSAGCIFKNPSPEHPAGAIIDRLGFKGLTVGGACVSEIHANFIVNQGGATAADVLDLIERIRERVRKEEQIDLELELHVIGEGNVDG